VVRYGQDDDVRKGRTLILLIFSVLFCFWLAGCCSAYAFSDIYVLKSKLNLREKPGVDARVLAVLERNSSLCGMESINGWVHAATLDGKDGWIRADLVSSFVLKIYKAERTATVVDDGLAKEIFPVAPASAGLPEGRYFATLCGGNSMVLSWPNRADYRRFLANGDMTLARYDAALVSGKTSMKKRIALCGGSGKSGECGAVFSASDFSRLATLFPNGCRVEIYPDAEEDRTLNRPDELSYRIYQGAEALLKAPAAGLRQGARLPALSYPGGDIQPDFATSPDILTRAVRHAGLDLQVLVHEDMLLHPGRYKGLEKGDDPHGAHRSVPMLFAYFSHNCLSLPTDVNEDLFAFEAGDIVFWTSGEAGTDAPDRVGVVSETFDRDGVPQVITVGGVGQLTRRQSVLTGTKQTVVGHFRMTHLFDYQ